jgi:hypothetical protein
MKWVLCILLVLLGISISANVFMLLHRRWETRVVRSVQQARATAGQTVDEVLRSGLDGILPTRVFWKVQRSELPFCDAQVLCMVVLKTGECRAFLWQWDSAWPSPRALTPATAEAFPLLDPGVPLTPTGQSTLWKGRAALPDYFAYHKNKPVPVRVRAQVLDSGIYRLEHSAGLVEQSTVSSEYLQPAQTAVLLSSTNVIPATVGTTFGFRFVLQGEPQDGPIDVEIVVRHPAFVKPDGTVTEDVDRVPWQYSLGKEVGYTYTFDREWEAAAGEWSFEIWHSGQKLAACDFSVRAH